MWFPDSTSFINQQQKQRSTVKLTFWIFYSQVHLRNPSIVGYPPEAFTNPWMVDLLLELQHAY